MSFSVTKNGKELPNFLYTWDAATQTFSSKEDWLVLDFSNMNKVTFNTRSCCTFNAGGNCTFNTGGYCTFHTGSNCTFDTGSDCTFNTRSKCTFTTGNECVVVRRDVFEIITLEKGKTIKLNDTHVKGFTVIEAPKFKTITIDGKDVEISKESFNSLKEYFKNQ